MFASNTLLELLALETQMFFDATFRMVRTILRQLFVPFADFAFRVCYAFMSQKMNELCVEVFEKVWQLVLQFTCSKKASIEQSRYSRTQTSLVTYTPAVWCRIVRSCIFSCPAVFKPGHISLEVKVDITRWPGGRSAILCLGPLLTVDPLCSCWSLWASRLLTYLI